MPEQKIDSMLSSYKVVESLIYELSKFKKIDSNDIKILCNSMLVLTNGYDEKLMQATLNFLGKQIKKTKKGTNNHYIYDQLKYIVDKLSESQGIDPIDIQILNQSISVLTRGYSEDLMKKTLNLLSEQINKLGKEGKDLFTDLKSSFELILNGLKAIKFNSEKFHALMLPPSYFQQEGQQLSQFHHHSYDT